MKRILLTIALASQAHAGIELCGLEFSPVPMPDDSRICSQWVHKSGEAQAGIEANQGGYIRPMVVTPPKIGTLAAGEKHLTERERVVARSGRATYQTMQRAVEADALNDSQVKSCRSDHFVDANKMLWALAQIESGGNDYAHGRHGEVSRYQCMKRVWRNATAQPYSAATNAQIAATVTLAVIRARTGQDPATLTPAAFALAWHCPNAKHLNAEQRDYVDRFTNLVRK